MKILWVSSRLIGPAASIVNSDYKGTSGSWIQNEYDALDKSNVKMFYLSGVRGNVSPKTTSDNGTVYCVQLPKISNGIEAPKKLVKEVTGIIKEISPDVIHIWGTETCLQDAVCKSDVKIPIVLFIQGLIGMHERFQGGYLNLSDKNYSKSIPIIKRLELKLRRMAFVRQVKIEKSILLKSKNVIVDNEYSKAYCYSVSPEIAIYNRQLNANTCFRNVEWNVNEIVPNTIFTVYGTSPDKGLHQLLKALCIVKTKFPNVKLLIPGSFNLNANGECKNKKVSAYEKWISRFVINNDLRDNVCFIGPQSQNDMAIKIKESNIFVNPSCMEVHALSLREAMTVGIPCISTLCGSVSEYLKNNENGMIYRYEEFEVLAYNIIKLLSDGELSCKIGQAARNDMINLAHKSMSTPLLNIYKEVIDRYV